MHNFRLMKQLQRQKQLPTKLAYLIQVNFLVLDFDIEQRATTDKLTENQAFYKCKN